MGDPGFPLVFLFHLYNSKVTIYLQEPNLRRSKSEWWTLLIVWLKKKLKVVRSRYILVLSCYIYIFITNIQVKYCWLIFFSIIFLISWVYIPEKIFSLDQKSYISWIFTIFLLFNLLPWDYTRRIVFTKYSVKELFRVFFVLFFVFCELCNLTNSVRLEMFFLCCNLCWAIPTILHTKYWSRQVYYFN